MRSLAPSQQYTGGHVPPGTGEIGGWISFDLRRFVLDTVPRSRWQVDEKSGSVSIVHRRHALLVLASSVVGFRSI